MKIRLYKPSDLDDVLKIYYDNVHEVCSQDYTKEQLDAWAPLHPDILRWERALNKNHTLVVEDQGCVVGFGDVGETGYIDRLYVKREYLRKGIGSQLVGRLEKYAKTKGDVFINTAASITSKPFFEALGYQLIQEQVIERRGIRIRCYLMEKKLV